MSKIEEQILICSHQRLKQFSLQKRKRNKKIYLLDIFEFEEIVIYNSCDTPCRWHDSLEVFMLPNKD